MKFKSLMFLLALLCTTQMHAQNPTQEEQNLWFSLTESAQCNPQNIPPQEALDTCKQKDSSWSFDHFILNTWINETHNYLLHEIVIKNNFDSVKWLFANITEETKNKLVLIQNNDGDTALHIACQQGNVEIATYILEQITDSATKQDLIKQTNFANQTAWQCANALSGNDAAKGSELMALIQGQLHNTSPLANFIASDKPEFKQQRKNATHGIALAGTLLAGYDYYQYNKRKTKKDIVKDKKKNEEKISKEKQSKETVKKNSKQKDEQKEVKTTETKTGFKAYCKTLYEKPLKHKKAITGLIVTLAAELAALTQ